MASERKDPDLLGEDGADGPSAGTAASGGAGAASASGTTFRLPPLLSAENPDTAPSQLVYSGKQAAVSAALCSRSAEDQLKLLFGPDADKRSLFHWAAAGGRDEVLAMLFSHARERGAGHDQLAAVLNRGDDAGMTPLSSAAAAGSIACIELLLAHGADANIANKGGQLPLHYHKGRAAIIAALLPVTRDINAADKSGATALHRAAGPGYLAAAEALLAAGARIGCKDRYVFVAALLLWRRLHPPRHHDRAVTLLSRVNLGLRRLVMS